METADTYVEHAWMNLMDASETVSPYSLESRQLDEVIRLLEEISPQ